MSNETYKEFHHFYQPLFCLSTWELYGYESLIRSKYFENPESQFQSAKNDNKLHELDMLSIKSSIENYYQNKGRGAPLFINVFPTTLLHPTFKPFLTRLISNTNILSSRIVFEIVEEQADLSKLKEVISSLTQMGFRFAIDDVGEGASSLKTIIELKPHFVKMDRYFAKNISNSDRKQRMIKSILDYCQNDTNLVLEGIETAPDLAKAISLGVTIGQGYLLGKPTLLENVV